MSNPDITLPDESEQSSKPIRTQFAFALVLLGTACVFFYKARLINSEAEIWPRTLAFLLIVLSLLQVARCVKAFLVEKRGPIVADPKAFKRRVFTVGWILAYCAAAPLTGFGLAMVFMMPAYMWLAGERRLWVIAVATVMAVAVVSFVFGRFAGVPIWEADL